MIESLPDPPEDVVFYGRILPDPPERNNYYYGVEIPEPLPPENFCHLKSFGKEIIILV